MEQKEEALLDRQQAAHYLTVRGYRVSAKTLAKYATVGGGPIYVSFGRRPLYKAEQLLDWAKQRTSIAKLSSSQVVTP